MRFAALSALLTVLGALLGYYTINARQIINWEKLDPVLQEQEIITQSATLDLLTEFYRRGELIEYLDRDSLLLLLISVFFIVGGTITTIHLIIDKLFYKKFYEDPNYFPAIRRGIILGAVPVALLILSLNNLLILEIAVIVVLIAIGLEVIALTTFSPRAKKKSDESEAIENPSRK
jgi:choline-glycine betaine transporter